MNFEMIKILFRSNLLFYGELEELLFEKLKKVLSTRATRLFLDGTPIEGITELEYWLILSVLAEYNFIEYGTSPRGSWLTPKGIKLLEEINSITLEDFYTVKHGKG